MSRTLISALTASQLRQRDVETEDFIGDLQHRIRELEKQNSSFRGKVQLILAHYAVDSISLRPVL